MSGAHSVWTLFKQQRLPAWQPLLTPPYVALWFAIIAALFIPLSVVLASANTRAKDFTFRYDDIHKCTSASNTAAFTYTGNNAVLKTGCLTEVAFELSERLVAPVYLYYGLTNFYQNHRRFSNSRNPQQLAGEVVPPRDLFAASPLDLPGILLHEAHTPIEINHKVYRYGDLMYAPAGLVPWSMFNDTFNLYRVDETTKVRALVCAGGAFSKVTNEPLEDAVSEPKKGCVKKGIAWSTDVQHRYKPLRFPPWHEEERHPVWSAPRAAAYGVEQSAVPQSNDSFFANGWYAGELGHAIPVTTDEDLMVWSRVASLPTFRKLYRIIQEDLEPGSYVMQVEEHFDTTSLGGQKSFSLATLSWLGGKNTFLAVMYLLVGIAALAFAVIFGMAHHIYGDRGQRAVGALLWD